MGRAHRDSFRPYASRAGFREVGDLRTRRLACLAQTRMTTCVTSGLLQPRLNGRVIVEEVLRQPLQRERRRRLLSPGTPTHSHTQSLTVTHTTVTLTHTHAAPSRARWLQAGSGHLLGLRRGPRAGVSVGTGRRCQGEQDATRASEPVGRQRGSCGSGLRWGRG